MNGLVIRYFMSGCYLCDGKPPQGRENDGELYIGNADIYAEYSRETSYKRFSVA
jgi:hypothetical protein